jgi:hypothetical protein
MRLALLVVVPGGVLVCALAQAQTWSPMAPITSPAAPSASAPSPSTTPSAAPAPSSAPAASSAATPSSAPAASSAPASTPTPTPAPAPTPAPKPADDSWAARNPQEAFYRRAAPPPADSWLVAGLLGIELEVRGAVLVPTSGASPVISTNPYGSLNISSAAKLNATGDILRGTEQPYTYDPFGLSITAGYRFLPFLSAGLFFDYESFQVKDGVDNGDYLDQVGGNTSQAQRQIWKLGAYGRYYLMVLGPKFHPWAELGVGYSNDTQSYVHTAGTTSTGQPLTTDYYLTHKGVVTNVRVGLDWRLAPVFSVGPVFGYEQVFPLSGCIDIEPQTDAQTTCDASVVQASSYGVFFGGIFAKVTLGPDL